MKRFIIAIVGLWLFAQPIYAFEIECTISETHGLVVFLETMTGHPLRSQAMKEKFIAMPEFQTPTSLKILYTFKNLTENNWRNILAFPEIETNDNNTRDKFFLQLVQSNSIENLEQRTKKLFQPQKADDFFSTLKAFDPLYRKYIWDPYKKNLLERAQEIQNLYKRKGQGVVDTIAKFYGFNNPEIKKLYAGLYPIIIDRGDTHAENFGLAQSVGVKIDKNEASEHLGVIMHEFSHYFYSHQTLEIKQKLTDTYQKTGSAFGYQAYNYLNEAVATAVGNGWAVKKMTGKESEDPWYDNTIIQTFAKGIYPQVANYLDSGKTMDPAFFDYSIVIFSEKLPHIIEEIPSIMRFALVLNNGGEFESKKLGSALRSNFLISDLTIAGTFAATPLVYDLDQNPNKTWIFVFSPNDVASLQLLIDKIPSLSLFRNKIVEMKSPSVKISRTKLQNPVFFIKATTLKEYEKAIATLKNIKTLPLNK